MWRGLFSSTLTRKPGKNFKLKLGVDQGFPQDSEAEKALYADSQIVKKRLVVIASQNSKFKSWDNPASFKVWHS
jgi:hypothetical protein